MGNLWLQETYIDLTQDANYGESDVYESFTSDRGELYRSLVKEYGRCTGKLFADGPGGKPIPVGWSFLKRRQYDDSEETFLAETWITVHEKKPTVTVEYHYAGVR